MLLWPHPSIPNEGFIKPKYDKILLKEAIAQLKQFAFADIIENPRIEENLQTWLGRSLTCSRANEAGTVPAPFRRPLHDELTAKPIALLKNPIKVGSQFMVADNERTRVRDKSRRFATSYPAAQCSAVRIPFGRRSESVTAKWQKGTFNMFRCFSSKLYSVADRRRHPGRSATSSWPSHFTDEGLCRPSTAQLHRRPADPWRWPRLHADQSNTGMHDLPYAYQNYAATPNWQ